MEFGNEIKSEGLGIPVVTVATQLVLLLLHARLWDHVGSRFHHNGGCLSGADRCGDNGRELDGALLELVGELLVQEIANHENCDNSNNVEHIEWRLGRDLLDGRTLNVIDDWGAHLKKKQVFSSPGGRGALEIQLKCVSSTASGRTLKSAELRSHPRMCPSDPMPTICVSTVGAVDSMTCLMTCRSA